MRTHLQTELFYHETVTPSKYRFNNGNKSKEKSNTMKIDLS